MFSGRARTVKLLCTFMRNTARIACRSCGANSLFVLWDEGNQMLFAARDRLGIKPLYYAVYDDTIYLASEIKALFAAGVPARWDHQCFYQYSTAYQMSDRTLFDGVYQVSPGYCLTTTTNGMRTSCYWDFNYS